MRLPPRSFLFGLAGAILAGSGVARAQSQPVGTPVLPPNVRAYYAAPGQYGTTYGVASYGSRRAFSEFSSPYGGGYGYGYAPATYLPGPYGDRLWAPTARPANSATAWRSTYYGTFALPTAPADVPPPPIGVYAPGFGPGVPPVYYGW